METNGEPITAPPNEAFDTLVRRKCPWSLTWLTPDLAGP